MPNLVTLSTGAFVVVVFALMLVRYSLLTSVVWLTVFKAFGTRFRHRKLQAADTKPKAIRAEIRASLVTMLIFAGTAVLIRAGIESGSAKVALDVSDVGWTWTLLSIPVLLVLHDAYFWATHRLLHTRWLFRHVHVTHHRAHNPTPFAAFAFHPVEALVQSGFVVLVAFTIPLHLSALLVFINISFAINVLGHLGFEFYPRRASTHPVMKFLTTSTHHNLHHQKTHGNYGLYFAWWDMAFGTLRADYHAAFDIVTSRTAPAATTATPGESLPLQEAA